MCNCSCSSKAYVVELYKGDRLVFRKKFNNDYHAQQYATKLGKESFSDYTEVDKYPLPNCIACIWKVHTTTPDYPW